MRRGLGRGRTLVGIGAVLTLISMPLAWYTVGGDVLPAISGNGLQGAGIAVFVSAVGLLALLALPCASGTGRSSLDRPVLFLVLAGLGVVGLSIEVVDALNNGRLGLPDRAPGLWLAIIGVLLSLWGAGELFGEKPAHR